MRNFVTEWIKKQIEKSEESSRRAFEYNMSHQDSHPVRRAKERAKAFIEMSKRFPGECRRVRRSMAFDSLRKKEM